MSVSYPKLGQKVVAKVIDMKGNCTIGMQKGDEFELSLHRCGEFCGYFYHNIHNWITMLQFEGNSPLGDDPAVMIWECPNPNNRVKIELRRVKE